jgi:cell filamentation protein, protein adenylyltransferase
LDVNKFTEHAPGRVVRDGDRSSFVPDDLPPNWQMPSELWPLLVEAHRHLALLEGVGRYLPNPAILLRPLLDREAIQSSRIEGTFATPREYLLFELAPREPSSPDDPANEWKEVHNYRQAIEVAAKTELPISNRLIKQLHQQLLSGVRGTERAPGAFRRVPVAIGTPSNPRFVPPPANELLRLLSSLEDYIHRRPRTYDPLVDCFLVHYQFETIHPFMDGNGRVGRLLLIVMIQTLCGLTKPWLHMSHYFALQKDVYVNRLFNVSAAGDWTSWIRFCLEGTVEQCRNTIQRCDALRKVKSRFEQLVTDCRGNSRLFQIVEMVFDYPFLAIVDVASRLKIHYQTAQSDLERLTSEGILRELPNHRPKTYFAPDVFHIAYEDLGTPDE